MAEFILSISTGSEAFESAPGAEVARILRDAADRVVEVLDTDGLAGYTTPLRDVNGNRVGDVTWTA